MTYDDSSDEARIQPRKLHALVQDVFMRCGMGFDDADLLADTLVYADLSGIHSHGVLRVPEYVEKLGKGGVNPRGRPKIVRECGACLVVDGGNSMGQIGAHFAMQQVIARAAAYGIAAAAIRGSNHCGALAYYASMALDHDMIGMATTNALPTMAPWGGRERILGINPLSVAIPAATKLPIVYDAAFSSSSHGKIRVYQQKGLSLPEGWALDREGRPTVDAAVAIDGLLAPIGGFKGAGLAMVMGVLASLLGGAAYGRELGSLEQGPRAGHDGHFVLAIQIAAFEEPRTFRARVDKAIHEIQSCRLAADFDRIYAPGEKEAINRYKYQRKGIPLNAVTLENLAAAARRMGCTEDLLDLALPSE